MALAGAAASTSSSIWACAKVARWNACMSSRDWRINLRQLDGVRVLLGSSSVRSLERMERWDNDDMDVMMSYLFILFPSWSSVLSLFIWLTKFLPFWFQNKILSGPNVSQIMNDLIFLYQSIYCFLASQRPSSIEHITVEISSWTHH